MYNSINREIKGYVEVLYDIKNLEEDDALAIYYYNKDGRPVQLTPYEYGKTKDDILSTPRVINNYSILYDNYVKLDGSFVLFNKFDNNCGFITIETPQEIYDNNYQEGLGFDAGYVIIELNIKEGMNGITFYFKDNTIKNAQIKLYKSGSQEAKIINIENNEDEAVFIDIDDTYNVFNMTIYEWTKPTHVMQWIRVDLGLSKIYKGEELIEFTVTEQVDKLCEESPNNELSLTIGDYDRLYDPLNPTGITKYLTENCVYIPHIGIVNEYGGIIYTKMGEFYFFQNDYKDKEVTITAYNLMYKLRNTLLENKNGTLAYPNLIVGMGKVKDYLTSYLTSNYSFEHNITLENKTQFTYGDLKRTNLAEFLQNLSMIEGIFYIDRDNTIILKNIDKTIKERLTKNELLNDISYKNEDKVESFNYTYYAGSIEISSDDNDKDNFTTGITLESDEQIICLTSDDPTSFAFMRDSYITQTGADSVSIIKTGSTNDFYYMIFLKVKGKIGSSVTIKGRTPKKINYSFDTKTNLIKVSNTNKEPSFDLNNPVYVGSIPTYYNKFPNFIDKFYSYSVSLDYNGNPNIKAGDYIEVESNYGMVKLFVTKHTLTYSGGLSGSIEGVE